jgi:hypothetical protein
LDQEPKQVAHYVYSCFEKRRVAGQGGLVPTAPAPNIPASLGAQAAQQASETTVYYSTASTTYVDCSDSDGDTASVGGGAVSGADGVEVEGGESVALGAMAGSSRAPS